MWMMIRLSREYSELIKVSVNYKGLQSDKIILPTSDTVFYIKLQTSGYNILFRKLIHHKYSTEIDLTKYSVKLLGNNYEININVSSLLENISESLKQKEKITSYIPESLKIKLDKAYTKKVPVILDADITFKENFGLYHKIYFNPDSVLVTGDMNLLKNIKFIKTEKHKFNNLSSNTSITLKLINNNNPIALRYSSDYVKLFIPVVKYIERSIEVPIIADSSSSDLSVETFPDKVKVFYSVNALENNKVVADSFNVSISEIANTNSKENSKKVIIKHTPSFVKILRIEPEYVDYSLKK